MVSLMTQLKAWAQSHRFAVFIQERSGQIERVTEHYSRLSKVAISTVMLSRQVKAQPEMEALHDAANKFRVNLYSEQQALLSEICDFISHGVLKTCFRCGSRQRTLKEMGFLDVEKGPGVGLSVNQTVMLFGLLLALVLGNFIVFSPPNADRERILLMITMIASTYVAAVICVVVPKQRWTLFQYTQTGVYPTAGYLLSGVMAVNASAVISLFFKTLIFVSSPKIDGFSSAFPKAWNQFTSDSYPWLTMAFVTAVSTAFLIDWRHPPWFPSGLKRIANGVFQAAFLMASGSLVHWWLSGLSASGAFGGQVPDMGSVLRITAVVGFTLGFVVPTWYRESSEKSVRDAAAVTLVDKHAALEMPSQATAVVKQLHGSH